MEKINPFYKFLCYLDDLVERHLPQEMNLSKARGFLGLSFNWEICINKTYVVSFHALWYILIIW